MAGSDGEGGTTPVDGKPTGVVGPLPGGVPGGPGITSTAVRRRCR